MQKRELGINVDVDSEAIDQNRLRPLFHAFSWSTTGVDKSIPACLPPILIY